MRRVLAGFSLVVFLLTFTGFVAAQPIPPNTERIHFHRFDNNYAGWTVYAWNDTTEANDWSSGPVQAAGIDSFGVYFDVGLKANAQDLGFIVHLGDAKDPGPDMHVNPQAQGQEIWIISGSTNIYTAQPTIAPPGPVPAGKERIHYRRFDNTYSGWTVYAFGGTTEDQNGWNNGPVQPSGIDAWGVYYDVGVTSGATDLGFILHFGNVKDPNTDLHVNPQSNHEVWIVSGNTTVYTSQPAVAAPGPVGPNTERIHYHRSDGIYVAWTVYAWGNTTADTNGWANGPVQPAGSDSYGIYFDVPLTPNATDIGFIIHRGDTKDPGPDMHVNPQNSNEIWIVSGSTMIFTSEPTAADLLAGLLGKLQAVWIDQNTILLPKSQAHASSSYFLTADLSASLKLTPSGVTGGTTYPLTLDPAGLTAAQAAKFPNLKNYAAFHPKFPDAATAAQILKGELVVSELNDAGQLLYVTQVQTYGVLDELFYYEGALGLQFKHGRPTISVWAPTAQNVKLLLFDTADQTTPSSVIAMKSSNGVWSTVGQSSWEDKFYLFDVLVYVPSAQALIENVVTDPYSLNLSMNSLKSEIVNLDAPANKPPGWDKHSAPALDRFNDLSIYELHIRDFSAFDESVPEELRGTYMAFADPAYNGMKHLRKLAGSGLKAVHLLPSFDIASVNEDKTTWKTPGDLSIFPADSDQQQAAINSIRDQDGFNWGYDPFHFFAPEGSYATDPERRILEYRKMVMGLHKAGLRVVQDEVFNHTSASGQADKSVLDKVVPNYYYRLNPDGQIYNGSCCSDTATEHLMMEKLMKDALLTWAKAYKIDGFRFDIMSFHSVGTMDRVQQALRQLTPDKDGVDGSKIYLYGEGFNFGEVANNAFFVNAAQVNLYGHGIGTFNDRVRDGIRGGNPFGDLREQGFATGLFTDPNPSYSPGTPSAQLSQLLQEEDWIRVGLTGNLRDFSFTDSTGNIVTGGQVNYNGQPTGYAATPIEAINYASVHDNQTLFDAVQMKTSTNDTLADRVRRHNLATSVVALGQGVPLFLAGDDMLRSKSLDQNSYNSGDWFNKLDFTYQSNNWGVGLPMKQDNGNNWPIEQPLLADAAIKPGPTEIAMSREWFNTLLRVRGSSSLFRMSSTAEIQQRLHFLNTGTTQIPGLIVMTLDGTNERLREPYNRIVVVFNATKQTQSFKDSSLVNLKLRLHPELLDDCASCDTVVQQSTYSPDGTVTVPGLTTAVFVSSAQ